MARDFDGTADYVSAGTSPTDFSSNVCTLAAWVYPDAAAGTSVVSLGRSTGDSEYIGIFLNSGNVEARVRQGSTTRTATQSGLTTGAWQHVGATYNGTAARAAWRNGSAGTANTQSSDPITLFDAIAIGALRRLNVSSFLNGRIAEAGVWSVALSAEDMAALAAGYSPLLVRPESLLFYAPLHGRNGAAGNEEDWVGGITLTQTSDPALADHPRIIYPRRRSDIWVPAAAGGAPTITALSARLITATSAQPRISYS